VQWDTEVTNQKSEIVAAYTVLTMVACRPDAAAEAPRDG
jgi:hypothetical protein